MKRVRYRGHSHSACADSRLPRSHWLLTGLVAVVALLALHEYLTIADALRVQDVSSAHDLLLAILFYGMVVWAGFDCQRSRHCEVLCRVRFLLRSRALCLSLLRE